jgi:outer membrane protein assembly factor BamB
LGGGEAAASDWARFRGPNGSGVSPDSATAPTNWSPKEGIKWKVALPGPGSSCPIVVGDKVLVTCWSGYAVDRGELGEQKNLKRHLVCFDRARGKELWNATVAAKLPEDRYGGMFAENGYASHTPASDGERVFAFFGKSGVVAFDMNGKQLWQTDVGDQSDRRGWGTASSPILFENLVIVTAAIESQALIALDKATGKEVWRKKAGGFDSTWGTPVLVKVDDKRTDLVIGVPYDVWGFDPRTGKFLWFCEAMDTDSFCSSLAVDGDTVIGIEGRGGGSIAVRAGGADDVTKSHVVWNGRDSNRIGTPVVYEGRVYFVANKIANCIDAKTGKKIFQARLTSEAATTNTGDVAREEPAGRPGGFGVQGGFGGGGFGGPGGGGFGGGYGGRGGRGGQDYGSPIIVDGKVYYTTRGGETFVFKAGDKFEQLAVNRVTDEAEDFSATPAATDGSLFIRSSKHLYCVGK